MSQNRVGQCVRNGCAKQHQLDIERSGRKAMNETAARLRR
jgi:hypothetical protein